VACPGSAWSVRWRNLVFGSPTRSRYSKIGAHGICDKKNNKKIRKYGKIIITPS